MSEGSEPLAASSPGEQQRPVPIAPVSLPPVEAIQDQARQGARHLFGFHFAAGPAPNVLLEKLGPDQITTIIQQAGEQAKQRYSLKAQCLWGALVAFVVTCFLFLHYNQGAMLKEVLAALGGLVAGFLGGLGYSKIKAE